MLKLVLSVGRQDPMRLSIDLLHFSREISLSAPSLDILCMWIDSNWYLVVVTKSRCAGLADTEPRSEDELILASYCATDLSGPNIMDHENERGSIVQEMRDRFWSIRDTVRPVRSNHAKNLDMTKSKTFRSRKTLPIQPSHWLSGSVGAAGQAVAAYDRIYGDVLDFRCSVRAWLSQRPFLLHKPSVRNTIPASPSRMVHALGVHKRAKILSHMYTV